MIPYARQDIDEADIQAVAAVLRSDWLTQGPAIERFERAVADYCGARFAVATCNATAALHIACLAAGLEPGGLAWTTPNTFVASANCVLYCGAQVDFVDIEPHTYNLSPTALEAKLEQAARDGRLPRVLIPVHFSGLPCDMEAIDRLARRYGVTVIEDAAHAIGARHGAKPVGAGEFSAMTVFSFHPVKIITTGEGGMVVTNSEELYEKLKRLRSHGITRETRFMEGTPDGDWYYEQIELGFNYRMTDIQAALGASQMRRLDDFVARRRELAARYDRLLEAMPVTRQAHPDGVASAHHLYVVRVPGDEAKHRQVFHGMRENGIGVNLHYIPMHTQPYYRRLGFRPGDFPNAEAYYREAMSLPLYYGLREEDQDRVARTLEMLLSRKETT